MDEWFCQIAGREIGPLSSSQLKAMAANGEILSTDSVRRGVTGKWILASRVRGLLPPVQDSPPVPPAAVEPPSSAEPAEPPSFFGSQPPPSFFGSLAPPSFVDVPPAATTDVPPRSVASVPAPNVAWPTEPPPAPVMAPPPPPPPPEDKLPFAPAATKDEEALAFDIFAEPVEPVAPSHNVKGLAALAKARRKRQQQALMVGVMVFVVCGLAIVCMVLATNSLQGVAVVKESGGLSGLSKKLKQAAASQPQEDDRDLDAIEAAEHVDAPALKMAEGEGAADSGPLRMGIGNCMVHVVSLIPAKDAKGTQESRRLLVTIEVKNLSNIEPSDFSAWSRVSGQTGVKLSDDQGKTYAAKPIDAAVVLGKPLPTTIEPGDSVRDIVAFELPESKEQLLDLEISGAAFGVNASATFKIPARKIAERPILLKPSSLTDATSKGAKKKHRRAEPGTPEGDFGLFDDEDEPTK